MILIDESRVERVTESGCHLWTGRVEKSGYGRIEKKIKGKKHRFRAHRIAWEQVNGPIPEGMFICHRCDVRSCVNPGHLFIGTHEDNMADMVRKGRSASSLGISKNSGLANGRVKLTEEQIRLIRDDVRMQKVIAGEYGITQSTVSKIKLGKRWDKLI